MLKTQLLHPEILAALGRAGHGSKILIADGNYPFSTRLGPNATVVHLNLAPGVVSCTQILDSVLTAVSIEEAMVMQTLKTGPYALHEDPPIWAEFRAQLGDLEIQERERYEFYDQASQPDVALTIASADQRIYANLLLTIGVVMPAS
jgi:L-fucose mutarotase